MTGTGYPVFIIVPAALAAMGAVLLVTGVTLGVLVSGITRYAAERDERKRLEQEEKDRAAFWEDAESQFTDQEEEAA
jgi:hypothetical protein